MRGGGFRVSSFPSGVRKTIHNIKEITGNHSEDEIYTMLKECSMDPNETVQRLLLQDPFREVKRKRDRKKGSLNNKEFAEPRWRSGSHGRGSKGGRGHFSTRHAANVPETSSAPARNAANQPREKSSVASYGFGSAPSSGGAIPIVAFESEDMSGSHAANSSGCSMSTTPASSSAICFSSSNPVRVPFGDSQSLGTLYKIKHEVGSSQASAVVPTATEITSSFIQGKVQSKSSPTVKNMPSEFAQPSSAATHGSSRSRPSSNYGGRLQQINGPQKVSSNKEWKPKPISSNVGQGSGTVGVSEVPSSSVEAIAHSQPVSSDTDSEEETLKLQKKLEELHLPQRQHVIHVIIPNHIHVPESEKTKLSFGSFDVSFGVKLSCIGCQESVKSPTPLPEASQDVDETAEVASSNQKPLATVEEGNYSDHPQSLAQAPETLVGDGDVSSSIPEDNENKKENSLLSRGHQNSTVHTPHCSSGLVPPILAPVENPESQARDISRISSVAVQQPCGPTPYYPQFYRSSADNDGRLSPFPSTGTATKYNGNVAVLPPQTSQSPQEGGNSLVLTTATPTPVATQPTGRMQSSLSVTQQPVPVYCTADAMHLPPNYYQYAPFYSPFYYPSPAIHQFINNGAFPLQPQAVTFYPSAPASPPTTGVKFSLPQFKPENNTVNTHIGMQSGYGPYGSSPAGYNSGSAATTGNSTLTEDLGAPQLKESNVYITGQQVGPGPFAGIYHPQGVTAAVHPLPQQAQTMAGAVDIARPGTIVYQQPQHAQMNWPSNY